MLFGLSHNEWMAGILCGAAYQGLVLRKNRLGDAMTAHAVTNCLLGGWMVWSRRGILVIPPVPVKSTDLRFPAMLTRSGIRDAQLFRLQVDVVAFERAAFLLGKIGERLVVVGHAREFQLRDRR